MDKSKYTGLRLVHMTYAQLWDFVSEHGANVILYKYETGEMVLARAYRDGDVLKARFADDYGTWNHTISEDQYDIYWIGSKN